MSDDVASQLTAHEREVLGLRSKRLEIYERVRREATTGRPETNAVKRDLNSLAEKLGMNVVGKAGRERLLNSERARMATLIQGSGLTKVRNFLKPLPPVPGYCFRRVPDLTVASPSTPIEIEMQGATALIGGYNILLGDRAQTSKFGVSHTFMLPYSSVWQSASAPYHIEPRTFVFGVVHGSTSGWSLFDPTNRASCSFSIDVEVFQVPPTSDAPISVSHTNNTLSVFNLGNGAGTIVWVDYEYGYLSYVPAFRLPIANANVFCQIQVIFRTDQEGGSTIEFGTEKDGEFQGRVEVMPQDFPIWAY